MPMSVIKMLGVSWHKLSKYGIWKKSRINRILYQCIHYVFSERFLELSAKKNVSDDETVKKNCLLKEAKYLRPGKRQNTKGRALENFTWKISNCY